jgi:branched-chain amino acid transport system substrate-binding protein
MPIDHRSGFGRTAQAFALSALVALGIAGAPAAQAQTAQEPVLSGVSGPLTGPQAQYGAQ